MLIYTESYCSTLPIDGERNYVAASLHAQRQVLTPPEYLEIIFKKPNKQVSLKKPPQRARYESSPWCWESGCFNPFPIDPLPQLLFALVGRSVKHNLSASIIIYLCHSFFPIGDHTPRSLLFSPPFYPHRNKPFEVGFTCHHYFSLKSLSISEEFQSIRLC